MSRAIGHILLIALLMATTVSRAQTPVTITGTAPFAAGEEIRLLVFNDLLNGIADVAATDIIDKHGRFALKYNTRDIALAQLAIRTSKAEFYIVPANSYCSPSPSTPLSISLSTPRNTAATSISRTPRRIPATSITRSTVSRNTSTASPTPTPSR